MNDQLDALAAALYDATENKYRAYPVPWPRVTPKKQEEMREQVRTVLLKLVEHPELSVDSRRVLDVMIGDSAAVTTAGRRAGMTDEEWLKKHQQKDSESD